MFDVVKRFYDIGLYSKANVRVFVQAGRITAEQYEQITGQPYVE